MILTREMDRYNAGMALLESSRPPWRICFEKPLVIRNQADSAARHSVAGRALMHLSPSNKRCMRCLPLRPIYRHAQGKKSTNEGKTKDNPCPSRLILDVLVSGLRLFVLLMNNLEQTTRPPANWIRKSAVCGKRLRCKQEVQK